MSASPQPPAPDTSTVPSAEARGLDPTVESLKDRLEARGGLVQVSDELPLELQRRFLERALAFEESRETTLLAVLAEEGHEVAPPRKVKGAALVRHLEELIHALASIEVYLDHTDHLSDRELYRELWRALHEPYVPEEETPGFEGFTVLDFIGGWSPEETQAYLRYYADEPFRQTWARDWPEDVMPPRQEPPFDRDAHLPGPAFLRGKEEEEEGGGEGTTDEGS